MPKNWFISLSQSLAKTLALITTILPSKARKRFYENIEKTGFQGKVGREKFYSEMMFLRIQNYLETFYELANPGTCSVENMKDFRQFLQENAHLEKSVLAVTAHLGNWELMGKFMASAMPSRKCLMLAKKNKYSEVTRLIEKTRVDMGMSVLFVSEKSGVKQIMKNLHSDTLIGFVADQKSEGRAGPKAEFFGIKTDFVSGPQRLSMKFKLPLLFCYAIRVGPLNYRVEFGKLEPKDGDDLQGYTQSMAKEFEKRITQYPEHWVWDYKKWVY